MYDKNFWNDRYTSDKYLYGTNPNKFLVEHSSLLSEPILSLSEGRVETLCFSPRTD